MTEQRATMTEAEGIAALKDVIPLLEKYNAAYWLGRGVFRHYTLYHRFGEKQSDADLHVLRESEADLEQVVAVLEELGWYVSSGEDDTHKLSLAKPRGKAAIEFVYLDSAADDDSILEHRTVEPKRKRYRCSKSAFRDARIEISGMSVRAPEESYLLVVFGERWRENEKCSGGPEV